MISKHIKTIIFSGFMLLAFTTQVTAQTATVIEISAKGQLSEVMSDGLKARIGTGHNDYLIVNYKTGSVKMVMAERKQVMLMDQSLPPMGGNSGSIKLSLKPLGAGAVIAGYATMRYQWMANGSNCGVIEASKQALATRGIKPLFNAMRIVLDKQRAAMGAYAALMNVCTRASLVIGDQVNKIGVPMRITKPGGQLISEIKSIKTGVRLAESTFDIPPDYQTVTMNGAVRNLSQVQNAVQQRMPQIQRQLKRMQQSGRLPPEAMRQLERYQHMMRQSVGR